MAAAPVLPCVRLTDPAWVPGIHRAGRGRP